MDGGGAAAPARPGGASLWGTLPALSGARPAAAGGGAPLLQKAQADIPLCPGRLRGGGPGLGADERLRGPALPDFRVHSQFHRRLLRNRLRFYHHRGHHSHGGRAPEPKRAVLAELHPLDRRHGGAGLRHGGAAHDRRAWHAPSPGGDAGALRREAGEPHERHGQDSLRHLPGHDPHRNRPAGPGGNAPVRLLHPRLRLRGHRRVQQ